MNRIFSVFVPVIILIFAVSQTRAQNDPVGSNAGDQGHAAVIIPEEPGKLPTSQATAAPGSNRSVHVYADVNVSHLLDAGIESTSGHVSTTRVGISLGFLDSITSQLDVGVSVDASDTFYRFSGASGLTPEGVRPWGTVEGLSLNIHGSYDVDDHWTIVGGATGATNGEQGAKFGSTLTGGGFAGVKYEFSKTLTVGLVLFGESTLEENPTILPFPIVDWALPFDPEHWRFECGGLRTGPSEAVGLGLIYSPVKELSFAGGLAGIGIGNDFRLDRNGPVPGGVTRDSSIPLIISVNYNPNPLISVGAFAGINTSDKLDLLNNGGGRINRVDEDTAPIFGLNGSIRY